MPPVAPQSSRAGLITAVVIFAILFVTATIFAIYYGVDAGRTHEALDLKTSQYAKISPDTSGRVIEDLESARGKFPEITGSMPLLTVATKQRDVLAKTMDASAPTATNALDSARAAVANASNKAKAAGVTIPPSGNLVSTVNALADAVTSKQAQVNDMQNQLATANQSAKAAQDQLAAAAQKMKEETDAIRAQAQQDIGQAAADRQAKQTNVGEIETARDKERSAAQEAVNKLNTEIQTKNRDIERLNRELANVRERLGGQRISANEPIMRAADGTIVRVPGNNVVYISRGASDQIVPGMTFEVYDRSEGIPKVTDPNSDKLPEGKASIEVIRVGPTSSECRVTHTKPGAPSLQEGDLIANLVYDPNVKYNFFVFGRFDLDQNGVATAQDTEVIKRLITQWGANVQDKINVDTDFVVLGKEPTVPTLTQDETNDPIARQKQAAAEAELNAYNDVLNRAKDLHIPILNQNRFLYLIGYYNQVKK